jgi:hypothetical protein
MSRRKDPLSRLRDANPLPAEEAPTPDSAQAKALLERIIAAPTDSAPAKGRAPRLRRWVLIPVVLAALAAASYGLFRHVRHPLLVTCYQRASLGANRAILPADGGDPIGACRALWRPGARFNPSDRSPAPSLAACVLPGGALGVFPAAPGADTCAGLGLARPTANPNEQQRDRALVALEDALADRFLTNCVGRDQAISFVRQQLARYRLEDWRVVASRPFTASEPCASVAYDVAHRTIRLIPVSDSTPP